MIQLLKDKTAIALARWQSRSQGYYAVVDTSITKHDIYTSLELRSSMIRLVTVFPGLPDDPIVCMLATVPSEKSSSYEALSYVWGELSHPRPVLVNRCQVKITANLHAALRHLRPVHGTRTLWIDTLCIDQNNTEERNEQVRKMASIYRNSQRVLIWLGTSYDTQTLDLIEDLVTQSQHGTFVKTLSPEYERALNQVIQNDWFCRIWTKQELAVSPKDPLVIIGTRSLMWSAFTRCVTYTITAIVDDHPYMKRVNDTLITLERNPLAELLSHTDIRNRHLSDIRGQSDHSLTLHSLLYRTRTAQASDRRDRVFAVMGLSSQPSVVDFAPDYSLNANEVCKHTIVQLLKAEKTLRPLLQWSNKDFRLPSWIPNYTNYTHHSGPTPLIEPNDEPMYFASGKDTTPNITFSNDLQRLHLRGLIFDTIDTVAPGKEWWLLEDEVFHNQRQKVLDKAGVLQYLNRSESLWRTLIAGKTYFGSIDDESPFSHREWYAYLQSGKRLDPEHQTLALVCMSIMEERCLFVTNACFIGIAPATLQEVQASEMAEYCVVIFRGGEVPFVVRSHGDWYELVGECYVAGVMNGEFVDVCKKFKDRAGCPKERKFELR